MGAEISALLVEPVLGLFIIGLSILAIIRENDNDSKTAKWLAIGAVALTIILIILSIILGVAA